MQQMFCFLDSAGFRRNGLIGTTGEWAQIALQSMVSGESLLSDPDMNQQLLLTINNSFGLLEDEQYIFVSLKDQPNADGDGGISSFSIVTGTMRLVAAAAGYELGIIKDDIAENLDPEVSRNGETLH